jgi:hypothetical protein
MFLFCVLVFSCKTVKQKRADSEGGIMYAMIYDYENTPVSGAEIYIDQKKYTESDINGRFILEVTRPGNYSVMVQKSGYEILEREFKFDPLGILYLKLINATQLLIQAENAMEQYNYDDAGQMIDRALAIEQYRPDALFLKSVLLYLCREYNESKKTLEIILDGGYTDESVLKLMSLLDDINNEDSSP